MLGLYDSVKGRILDLCPAVLQAVTGSKPEEMVETIALGADVSVIVHPMSTTADPVREAGMVVSQRELIRFGVTMVLVFPGGFAQFEAAAEEIKVALRGWKLPGASMPVQFAVQRTLQFSAGQDGGRQLELLEFTVPTQVSYEVQT